MEKTAMLKEESDKDAEDSAPAVDLAVIFINIRKDRSEKEEEEKEKGVSSAKEGGNKNLEQNKDYYTEQEMGVVEHWQC
jgi:hypothetical protein